MKGKILAVMAALVLMTTSFIPSSKVQGQSPIGAPFRVPILAVVGLGNDETVEMIFARTSSAADSQESNHSPYFTTKVTNTSSPDCAQTVFGLPMLGNVDLPTVRVSKGYDLLKIDNGQEVVIRPLDACFGDDRVVLQVGNFRPPTQLDSVPTEPQTPNFWVRTFSIYGQDGATRAASRPAVLFSATQHAREWVGPAE